MDIYFTQQIDNSRVARVADPRRVREQRTLMLALAAIFLLLFGYAWQRYEMVELGYRVQAARHREADLEQWNRGLRLQEASLRAPGRIYALAENLQMESAQPGQIVALDAPAPAAASPVIAADLSLRK